MQNTIRLTALCDITGQSKEAVRNYQKHGDAPWLDEKEFGDATQRRYSGYHALALILAEMLRAQGCSVSLAGEFVQVHETAINMFLDEVGDNLSKVAITVAVLSNDVSALKDDVRSLELYVRGPSVRPGNFVIPAPAETPIHSIEL